MDDVRAPTQLVSFLGPVVARAMQLRPVQLVTAFYGYAMFIFLLFLSFFCNALAAPCGHQTANRWKERVMGRWLVYAMQCACIWYVRRWIAAVISGHRTLHSARDDEKIHTVFFCPDTADRPD